MIDKLSLRAQMDAEHPDAVLADLEQKQANRLAAQALGRLAKGQPKHYSAKELALRSQRLARARLKRWPVRKTT